MTVRQLIDALCRENPDATVVTNVWVEDPKGHPDTIEGDVTLVVAVSAGVAIKGDEIT